MAMLHSLKVYLGLGPDEEYDDSYLEEEYDQEGYDDAPEPPEQRVRSVPQDHGVSSVRTTRNVRTSPNLEPEIEMVGTVRPIRVVRKNEMNEPESTFTPRPSGQNPAPASDPNGQLLAVRPVRVGRSKPRTIEPDSFSDAKVIADEFSAGTPVVINMQGLSKDLSRRLIDFASGVCYVQNGSMRKLARGVFLVTPKSAEVNDEELRRLEDRGYKR